VIRGVGQSGGVMGIFMMTMWLTTDPTPSVDAYVRQIQHVVKVAGIDSVGIANDYTIAWELTANIDLPLQQVEAALESTSVDEF
jgi:membrane dipeptidase